MGQNHIERTTPSCLELCFACLPDDVQKATRLSFLTAILLMGLHSQKPLSVRTHTLSNSKVLESSVFDILTLRQVLILCTRASCFLH